MCWIIIHHIRLESCCICLSSLVVVVMLLIFLLYVCVYVCVSLLCNMKMQIQINHIVSIFLVKNHIFMILSIEEHKVIFNHTYVIKYPVAEKI